MSQSGINELKLVLFKYEGYEFLLSIQRKNTED